ncbi:hypothetical protein H0H92_014878 [Tricholoma furcatifolium]|nr:hypothetical protein H0H92_014878 [Tricholoma furcatifolium]
MDAGRESGGLYQSRGGLCQPGERRAVREAHAVVPRAEPSEDVEGGCAAAPHDDVACVVVVRAVRRRERTVMMDKDSDSQREGKGETGVLGFRCLDRA